MVGRRKLPWKAWASNELLEVVSSCGMRSGKFYTLCRRFACRRCRITRLGEWHWRDMDWAAGRTRLRLVEIQMSGECSFVATVRGQKRRIKELLRGFGGGSVRGYATIDNEENVVFRCVFDLGQMGERAFKDRIGRLWPGSTLRLFDGDFVSFYQPLVDPLAGAHPEVKSRLFNCLNGYGFRNVRVAFGGRTRTCDQAKEKEIEPMEFLF